MCWFKRLSPPMLLSLSFRYYPRCMFDKACEGLIPRRRTALREAPGVSKILLQRPSAEDRQRVSEPVPRPGVLAYGRANSSVSGVFNGCAPGRFWLRAFSNGRREGDTAAVGLGASGKRRHGRAGHVGHLWQRAARPEGAWLLFQVILPARARRARQLP